MAKINHIGIVVDDLEKYIEHFQMLGGDLEFFGEAKEFGAECVFIKFDNVLIELIKGNVPENHLNKFVEKYGSGLHHIAIDDNRIIGTDGAKPGMKVGFNKPSEEFRILIERVKFE